MRFLRWDGLGLSPSDRYDLDDTEIGKSDLEDVACEWRGIVLEKIGKINSIMDWPFDKSELIPRIQRECAVATRLMKQRGQPRGPQWDEATEARNKWIYEQCVAIVPYKTIRAGLRDRPEWSPISSDQGIKKAAEAYAQRHKLPVLPRRKCGRPPKKKVN